MNGVTCAAAAGGHLERAGVETYEEYVRTYVEMLRLRLFGSKSLRLSEPGSGPSRWKLSTSRQDRNPCEAERGGVAGYDSSNLWRGTAGYAESRNPGLKPGF